MKRRRQVNNPQVAPPTHLVFPGFPPISIEDLAFPIFECRIDHLVSPDAPPTPLYPLVNPVSLEVRERVQRRIRQLMQEVIAAHRETREEVPPADHGSHPTVSPRGIAKH